ncbi:DUF5673 domain-containing protein [candidate division KSB1 bacterium]
MSNYTWFYVKRALIGLIGIVICLGTIGLIYFGFKKILPEFWGLRPVTVWFFLCTIFIWVIYILRYRRKRRAGDVLLNLGKLRYDKLNIFIGILFIISGTIDLIDNTIMNKPDFDGIIGFICVLSFGVCFLIIGLKGSKISKKGITSAGFFVLFEKIKSYKWEGKKENILSLKLKRRLPIFQTVSFPVRPTQKDEVERLLKENVS